MVEGDSKNPPTLNALSSPRRKYRLADMYDPPVTDREGWWRSTLRETPGPAKYDAITWINDLEKKEAKSAFRSSGRTRPAHPFLPHEGTELLPGAYDYMDFGKLAAQKSASASFFATGRDAHSKNQDKLLGPGVYETHKIGEISSEKLPSYHYMFRSLEKRASKCFHPKEGPAPGQYTEQPPPPAHPIKSSFQSKVPRLTKSQSITPGPGAYGPLVMYPGSKIF